MNCARAQVKAACVRLKPASARFVFALLVAALLAQGLFAPALFAQGPVQSGPVAGPILNQAAGSNPGAIPASKLPAALTAADLRARKVIDDALAALGGDKFLHMEDRVETGRAYSFYNDRLSGLTVAKIYTRYVTVAEGRTGHDLGIRERQAFGPKEDSATVFREDGAADVNWRGAKALPDEQFERYRDSTLHSVLYILRVRLHEPGLTFESRGVDVVDHLPVDVVDIIDSQGRVVTVFFHQSTKLPVKQKFVRRDPKTHDPSEEVTNFARYRPTDGIQWPQEITRERDGEKIYQIFAETVAFNQNLTDDLFDTTAPTTGKSSKRK